MTEEWRVIPDFPDYAVSNHGRVKRAIAIPPDPHKIGGRGWPVHILALRACMQNEATSP